MEGSDLRSCLRASHIAGICVPRRIGARSAVAPPTGRNALYSISCLGFGLGFGSGK
jgi:hypothetical protein